MKKYFLRIDYILFFSCVVLTFIGILFIYSSGINSDGILTSYEFVRQIIWATTGIILVIIASVYDYNKIKEYSILIYGLGILALTYTLFFGKYTHGAKSWLGIGQFGIQPSEFMKLAYVVFLSFYLERSQKENVLMRFIKAGVITMVPMLLILLQPDLGTASVYIPVFLILCFVSGIKVRYIAFVFFVIALGLIFILYPIWESYIVKEITYFSLLFTRTSYTAILLSIFFVVTVLFSLGFFFFRKRYYYWLVFVFSILCCALVLCIAGLKVLKPYQMMRLIVFLDPNIDALNSGWNINQSMIAIGAGGFQGAGFLKGTQSHYKFLPEQSTDFIFSILLEEWGFIGGLVVFGLYVLIFLRIQKVMSRCVDFYGKLVCVGILVIFFYHFCINVGMVMGIMPIMGIPLLFLSYGGSSLWAAMLGLGLILGINVRQIG